MTCHVDNHDHLIRHRPNVDVVNVVQTYFDYVRRRNGSTPFRPGYFTLCNVSEFVGAELPLGELVLILLPPTAFSLLLPSLFLPLPSLLWLFRPNLSDDGPGIAFTPGSFEA